MRPLSIQARASTLRGPRSDQVAQCEEAVVLWREADAGKQGLECRELAVHVPDHEITASGRIGFPRGRTHAQALAGPVIPCTLVVPRVAGDAIDAQDAVS